MNGRGGVVTFFIFLFLSVVILLQILSMVQSDRLYEGLNRLDEIFEGAAPMRGAKGEPNVPAGMDEEYPGDEGDWLVWAFRVEPKTLNQISADRDIYSLWITTPYIFEPLLDYDYDEIKLVPWLAESYEVSSDGLEITFRLRDNIYFSDGVPVTADDVIFTYETVVNPGVDAANLANYYRDVDKAVKISDREVKFIMKRPYFKALEIMALTDIGIMPKHIYEFDAPEDFNRRISNPVGSGPYLFEKWDVGREVVLRRNENYWGRKPKLKRIVYKFILNTIACLQALRSGQIDIMIPEPEQFADLDGDAEFKRQFYYLCYYEPRVPFSYIGWNQDTVFFSDQRVRLAMTHIVNREQIVTHLIKGSGRLTTGPFYIGGNQDDPDIEPWPCDPERAKQLLDEAGWVDSDGDGIRDKDGTAFKFKFMYSSGNTFYQRLVKVLRDEAAKVGIELIPDPFEWSVLLPRLSDRKFEAMVMGWGGDVIDDPYQIWHSSQIGNRGSNYVGFNNRQADALIEEARRTLDENKRNELYHQLHRILHEEQPYTFLFERPIMRLLDRRFENVIIHKKGLNWLEWYVPKGKQKYK